MVNYQQMIAHTNDILTDCDRAWDRDSFVLRFEDVNSLSCTKGNVKSELTYN